MFITADSLRALPTALEFPASNWVDKTAKIENIRKRRNYRYERDGKPVSAMRLDFEFHGDVFVALVGKPLVDHDGEDAYDFQMVSVFRPENLEHAGEKGWATVQASKFRKDSAWVAMDDPGHGIERDDASWLVAVGQILANII